MRRAGFLLASAAFLLLPGTARAQITGTIDGVVLDPAGAVLPGATVTAESLALRRGPVSATTDAEGRYRLTGLQAGDYELRVELSGFASAVRRNISLPVGTTLTVNVTMQLAGVEETVTVMADVAPVRLKESSLGVDIDNTTIDAIPLRGREFLDLLTLVPGVAIRPPTSDQGANITVFGERSITNSFLIDGHDNNDLFSRSNSEFFIQDAIQEFKVYLAGYPAEFGRASGAVANVITRSGTNQVDGRAFFFVRNDALNSSNIEGQVPQELSRYEVGGTIGGPIRKDKTFFFDAFQYVYEKRGLNFDQSVLNEIVRSGYFSPAVGGNEPFDASPLDKLYTNLFKLDHQFNEKNQIFVSLNINRGTNANFVPSPEEAFSSPPPGTIALPSTASDRKRDTTSVNARYTSFFRGSSFLESSVRYWNGTFGENTEKPQGAEQLFPLTFVPRFQIWQSNASAVGVIDREQDRLQWVEHLSYFADTASGSHAMKFGVDLDHVKLDQAFLPPRGIIIGNSILDQNFRTLGYDITMQRFISPIVSQNDRSQATTNNWALFAQDGWEVKPGLTLNLGLRYDYSSLFGDDKNNFAPRLGISWDIRNDQKTIFRAGYGRFYDVSILETVQFTPALGGIQFGVLDLQIIPRGAAFFNNPAIGAFGPLQDSGTRWLGNPTLFEYIIPQGQVRTSAGTFFIQRNGQVVQDNRIVGRGNPYIIYDVLGIPVANPANPPVLTYESIPRLTQGRLTPEQALGLLNAFFPHPTGAGPQFDFLEDQGPNSIIRGRPLIYKFRQLQPQIDVIQTISEDHKLPHTDAFNFGIEQAIGRDLSLDAEFHIRRSRNLLTRRVSNLLPQPIAASCSGNTVNRGPCERELENLGFLDTEALTIALKKRFGNNYSFLASYSWTNASDNFSTLRVPPRGGESSFLFSNQPELDEGRSLNTPDHVFVLSGLYRLPHGVEVSGVVRAQSGRPFNAAGLPIDSDGDNIFDNRLLGTEKGQFSTDPFFQLDLRLAKEFALAGGSRAIFLIEFFNLTNRANPFVVNTTCGDSNGDNLPDPGGCSGATFGSTIRPFPGREIQIAVKFDF
jgi:outer membrane receptor protein involved in Fe transport